MNPNVQRQLKAIVDNVVGPVVASDSRKQLMHEELLAHVTAVYAEEVAEQPSPQAALQNTRRRFGVAEEVRSELQASIPQWENCLVFLERSILMSRWFWLIALFAVAVGPAIILPALAQYRQEHVLLLLPLVIGSLITLAGLGGVCYGVARHFRRAIR